MDNQPVSFPSWKQALAGAGLAPVLQSAYVREIITFLSYCKTNHVPATVLLAKHYVETQERLRTGPVREALRWFFRTAKVAAGGKGPARTERDPAGWPTDAREGIPDSRHLRPMQPKRAGDDLGVTEWENALIKTMRLRGMLWRTEYTYRSWARRFARYIAPKTPYAAGGDEVQAFLTDLALHGRASASGQRQALNALVFLMQEALGRELGQLDFKRAVPRERVPTVLTPDECQRIFHRLDGTPRLMAQLAYGAGLRLMELLRLRVQHVDLARRQLTVRGGKGDKDRVKTAPRGHAA